jgi:hypothetical protein
MLSEVENFVAHLSMRMENQNFLVIFKKVTISILTVSVCALSNKFYADGGRVFQ